ncbi:MAG TPA: hypothetical protein VLX92_09390 [Kofleriaceae bacterium]|nr:hypothetical protein [Kofleriaceae bacterium]
MKLALAPVLLAAATPAHADDIDPIDHPRGWHVEGALGYRVGSAYVDGSDTGTDVPGYVLVGARAGRLFLAGEYDLMSVTYPLVMPAGDVLAHGATIDVGDGHGLVQRLGVTARWAFGHASDSGVLADLYAEAGAGVERWAWDSGGVWVRPDVALGVGSEMLFFGERRHGGFSMGLRVTLAPRDHVVTAAACGGPCNYATPPTGIDRSFMFDMAILFGR